MAKILVVNDTQEILEAFRDILEDEGYEVVLYSYAIEDIKEVVRINPDLIILDLVFGNEKTGWQMLQKLKMRRSTARIPVIVSTAAHQTVREQEGYLNAKGVKILLKPFDIDDLITLVTVALKHVPATAEFVGDNPAGNGEQS